jgi:hypothetical protein
MACLAVFVRAFHLSRRGRGENILEVIFHTSK